MHYKTLYDKPRPAMQQRR